MSDAEIKEKEGEKKESSVISQPLQEEKKAGDVLEEKKEISNGVQPSIEIQPPQEEKKVNGIEAEKKVVVEGEKKNGTLEGEKKNGSGKFQPKTYVIAAAQAIQSGRHALYYGEDLTKGAPNRPLIQGIDEYSKKYNAETMILQMQGMSCDEIHLHKFFETRGEEKEDVYINKNKSARLKATIEREKGKINAKIERLDTKIGALESIISARDEDGKDSEHIEDAKEELEGKREELEEKLNSIRDADYFKEIGIRPLNGKIVVADLIVPPQNVDPATGRLDIAQNQLGKTIIFAHSKQRWKCAPKSIGRKLPRLLITTGAITHPNYNTTNSRGDEALWNHKYGFVVVDVLSEKEYLPRIVPSFKNGAFVDMGFEHRPGEEPKRIGVEALTLGDIHFGDHDPVTMKSDYEMIEFFAPKNVFLHDAINGHSVNPHEREDTIKRAIAFREGRLDIKKEFSEAYDEFIGKMAKQFPNTTFHFVYSNHSPDFMRRYLTECQYINEPWNDTPFTSELRNALLRDEQVTERGLEIISQEREIKGLPENVRFLRLEEGVVMLGYQLGVHGHKGINGARGTPRGMKAGYGKVISAHTHTPEINGDCYTAGTSSIIPLDYAKGQPGTAMPANVVLYSNGLAQLIPIILGAWIPPHIKILPR